jgi:hypothetical protein
MRVSLIRFARQAWTLNRARRDAASVALATETRLAKRDSLQAILRVGSEEAEPVKLRPGGPRQSLVLERKRRRVR